ncbi:MAG TPA: GC-type dockerin domain-anchored protein [Phycisphaerales bacterium]|nr:GC-type dockerin domain-anchored protein [Phycisphaerales bacterium]
MKPTSHSRLTALAIVAAAPIALAQPPQTPLVRNEGPDGLIGVISDANSYGTRVVDGTLIRAFAFGTYTWNMGDRPMIWVSGGNQHALASQNLYRATGKRFEQIGAGWLKNVLVPANQTFNAGYGACVTNRTGGTYGLGVNCHDLYGSGFNSAQGLLGPRFSVDPTTGVYTYPFTTLVPPVAQGDNVARRVFVRDSDVQPAQNPGSVYYGETGYHGGEDAAWGNGRNNFCSVRLAPFGALPTGTAAVQFDGPSYRTSALEYWAWATPGVVLSYVDVFERSGAALDKWRPYVQGDTQSVMLPSDQWVTLTRQLWTKYVATSAATDNGDGTWTYDIALLNMNSHRAGGELSLHLPPGAAVSATAFSAPMYHSGDRIRNAPWIVTQSPGKLSWRVDPATQTTTYPSVGPVTLTPNALLFSTVYSFRLTVDRAPATGHAHLSFWRPPADATGEQGNSVAITGMTLPAYCAADVGSTGGVQSPDGSLDNNDFVVFIDAFFNDDRFRADVGSQGGSFGPDNALNNNDFIVFIDAFFDGCV